MHDLLVIWYLCHQGIEKYAYSKSHIKQCVQGHWCSQEENMCKCNMYFFAMLYDNYLTCQCVHDCDVVRKKVISGPFKVLEEV